MLKIYGTWLCPDCRDAEQKLNAAGVQFEFIDIFNSTANLKEFLTIRDNSTLYDEVRKNKAIGVPTFVKENGDITLNIDEVLELQ